MWAWGIGILSTKVQFPLVTKRTHLAGNKSFGFWHANFLISSQTAIWLECPPTSPAHPYLCTIDVHIGLVLAALAFPGPSRAVGVVVLALEHVYSLSSSSSLSWITISPLRQVLLLLNYALHSWYHTSPDVSSLWSVISMYNSFKPISNKLDNHSHCQTAFLYHL